MRLVPTLLAAAVALTAAVGTALSPANAGAMTSPTLPNGVMGIVYPPSNMSSMTDSCEVSRETTVIGRIINLNGRRQTVLDTGTSTGYGQSEGKYLRKYKDVIQYKFTKDSVFRNMSYFSIRGIDKAGNRVSIDLFLKGDECLESPHAGDPMETLANELIYMAEEAKLMDFDTSSAAQAALRR